MNGRLNKTMMATYIDLTLLLIAHNLLYNVFPSLYLVDMVSYFLNFLHGSCQVVVIGMACWCQ